MQFLRGEQEATEHLLIVLGVTAAGETAEVTAQVSLSSLERSGGRL